ncbi:response regulator [Paenibacillus roseipurpureus]|uniref:Response regulator n=1 Tax=Paenibacillus roseopurpureus TaxID=2918901 RepID=A0AA96LRS2_9BACL|nr:response regulator [Paenibacillus sp. MBLB1832]WNR46034.1 response regulator [Paenibacillus sp. MBLB1832]
MYKLLIVDDEADIREGLAAFPWDRLHIEVTGICEHGLDAYHWLQQHPVDIVITDIRMPLMNGLELAEKINKQFPYVKTVILTGFDDFEYARASIRVGVVDYLLKPTQDEPMMATFLRVKETMDKEKQEEQRLLLVERRSRLLAGVLRKEFLHKLTSRPLTRAEIDEGSSVSEVMLDGKAYRIMMIRQDHPIHRQPHYAEKEWELVLFALDNVLTELWDAEGHGYHLVDEATGDCMLIGVNSEEETACMSQLEALRQQLYRFRGLLRTTLSIGLGGAYAKLDQLHLSRRQAENALIKGTSANGMAVDEQAPGSISHAEGSAREESTAVWETSEASTFLIDKAKSYIHNHYQRSITLSEVAEHIHISPTYFSFLFKEMTGENYVQYVTTCRVEKAKQLLKDSYYKVYEIGEMVGYENPRYFSEIFKKMTGKTPNDYRGAK